MTTQYASDLHREFPEKKTFFDSRPLGVYRSAKFTAFKVNDIHRHCREWPETAAKKVFLTNYSHHQAGEIPLWGGKNPSPRTI